MPVGLDFLHVVVVSNFEIALVMLQCILSGGNLTRVVFSFLPLLHRHTHPLFALPAQNPEISVIPRATPEPLDPRKYFFFCTKSSSVSPASFIVSGGGGKYHSNASSSHASGAVARCASMKDWGMYDSHSHLYSRQYYHSQTCLPVTHAQLDYDSDDDVDDSWIVRNDEKLLDEFDDVSAKEKALMKLWNRHVRSYRIYADHNIPKACEELVRTCSGYLKKMGLRPNLLLHMYNLWDNGLVHSGDIMRIMKLYDELSRRDGISEVAVSSSAVPGDNQTAAATSITIGHGPDEMLVSSNNDSSKYPPLEMPSLWSLKRDEIVLSQVEGGKSRGNKRSNPATETNLNSNKRSRTSKR